MSRAVRSREKNGPPRCIGEILAACSDLLESAGVLEAQRESRDILAALLDVPRFWPAANLAAEADSDLVLTAIAAAQKRINGAPFAYAVGRVSFRHLTLDVDERVLIPRVETEVLVDRILERCSARTRSIADIGTGSGAIALSLALEGNFDRVVATDVSLDALSVASGNAESLTHALKTRVEFRAGSLLAPVAADKLDAVVSNPPYIAFGEAFDLPAAVRDWEPCLALLCPDEGLAVTRELVRGAPAVLKKGGLFALEVDTRRAGMVAEMISVDRRYSNVEVLLDLTGRERFVFARRA